ncbi:TRAP transporter small permease subunit [Truepera radiovictrix]|uniref:Tripartite ATP-independent periplasmic transporter DctQ component n=1 Tax=Truepera radiovictrix (strain DSM 17093 / CIP 108686 / LMG 22925 / RQ-24) TaxID=649638 RepID=D7CXX6_TRURR|nr:TRAP transporter small permease subunit [Truepera radiovictrix]ADI13336.1 Tripartite ATP-independent periplasmic transporter DctQ component [Truepera radiovictrix DSM 17093]WMT58099.1 TRAP transporter small permease subunit [Truepera radiovictrix]
MAVLRGLLKGIDALTAAIAKVVAWLLLPLVLFIAYEVLMRYAFNRPTLWVFDMSYFLTSLVVSLGAAYTLQRKGHVSVDVFYERFPERVRAFIDVLFYLLLFFTTWLLIINVMVPHVINSWQRGELAATGIWRPPIYPFKTWILVGVVLLVLQGVAEFIRALFVLLGRPLETPPPAAAEGDVRDEILL